MATTTDRTKPAWPNRPRREEAPVRFLAVIGVLFVLAGLTTGAVIDSARRPALDLDLLLWGVATVAATFATISLGRDRPALSMDLPVLLACAFVLGPLAAGTIAFLAVTNADEVRGRTTLSRIAWNHSQTSLSVIIAGYVFVLLGGQLGQWPIAVLAAIAALSADALVNYVSVAFLLAVSERQSMGSVLNEMTIGSPVRFAVTYTAFGMTGLLIAAAFDAVGFVALLVAIAPVLLAHEVFVKTLRVETINRQLRARAEALMRVDERIADERRDERARIAEALHDDVLQALYSVTLRAHVIREDYRSGRLLDLEDDVPEVVGAAESAAAMLREVIFGLRRASVGHGGLIDTVSLLVAHLHDQSGVVFVADLDATLKAEPLVELLVYQVVREALTNVVRHSEAETAWVSLTTEGEQIHLSVLDNGRGFDLDVRRSSRHFGLDLMQERVRSAGGNIDIRSNRDGGTCVEAWFPTHSIPINGLS